MLNIIHPVTLEDQGLLEYVQGKKYKKGLYLPTKLALGPGTWYDFRTLNDIIIKFHQGWA